MGPVGTAYDIMLSEALNKLAEDDRLWRRPRSPMIPSVSGEPIAEDVVSPRRFAILPMKLDEVVLGKATRQR